MSGLGGIFGLRGAHLRSLTHGTFHQLIAMLAAPWCVSFNACKLVDDFTLSTDFA